MAKGGTVYILTNRSRRSLYVGVTSDLGSRLREHIEGRYPTSFTNRYKIKQLVFYRSFSTIEQAIDFEKYVKVKKRNWKDDLVESFNPEWKVLNDEVLNW